MTARDRDGQPNFLYRRKARYSRGTDELLGFLRGIIADDEINEREIETLTEMVCTVSMDKLDWPLNVIANRLSRIYEDNIVTEEERDDLRLLLTEIVGSPSPMSERSTTLPLCQPAPDVIFEQNQFVLTGKFVYGSRAECAYEVQVRGGQVKETVTLDTSYLVIGTLCSRDWIHTPWGRKIEKAVEYRDRKLCPIAIISEEQWAKYLLAA